MVWSGYAVLMSGKTDSIKLNNILGCLSGSTFVYSEVFKLDFSSASLYSALVTIHPSSIMRKISWYARHASSLVLAKSSIIHFFNSTYSLSCPTTDILNHLEYLIIAYPVDNSHGSYLSSPSIIDVSSSSD
ncbi:hypothetical protein Tco_0742653 [Tanacetum coccineum]